MPIYFEKFITEQIIPKLETIILASHQLSFADKKIHPYPLMLDVSILSSLIVSFTITRHWNDFSYWKFLCSILIVYTLYEIGFIRIKKRVTGNSARSFLQDTLLFSLPSLAIINYLVGNSLVRAFDLIGVILPLILSMARIGCFLGGCCYGVDSPIGIYYSPEIFEPQNNCRNFTPGPIPGKRVFPLQLVESAWAMVIFLMAIFLVIHFPVVVEGRVMSIFFLMYAPFRMIAERYRGARHTKKIGKLSQAQFISALLVVISLFWNVLLSKGIMGLLNLS